MENSNCPDSGTWQEFLEGSLPPEERLKLERHLVTCLRCRVGLISDFDTRQELRPAVAPSKVKYRWIGLAATVVIAVGLTLLVYRFNSQPTAIVDPTRSTNSNSMLTLMSPSDGAQLSRTQVEFSWNRFTGDARYVFTLTDERGDIVAREETGTNKLVLDLEKLELSAAHTYYWTVTARLRDGVNVESSVASFKLK